MKNALKLSITLVSIIISLWIIGCEGPTGAPGDNAELADSLAPQIEWISPEPGLVIDSAVTLSVRASDDDAVRQMSFYIAGLEFSGILIDSAQGIYEFEWLAKNWEEGPYTLMARVWDRARNCATTPVIFVQVEHP
ncbi:MAG: Ig-like domain-containing protein [Candidatus Hatepunaea meridiana]|nr:Ig-like domain-containing protein [Candidatus Hatepunaea meridiana]